MAVFVTRDGLRVRCGSNSRVLCWHEGLGLMPYWLVLRLVPRRARARSRSGGPGAGSLSTADCVAHGLGVPHSPGRCFLSAVARRIDLETRKLFRDLVLSSPRPVDETRSSMTLSRRRVDSQRCAARANSCERRDVRHWTGNRLEGAEIPAGHGPAVRPTEPRRGGFPRRLAVRVAAHLRLGTA